MQLLASCWNDRSILHALGSIGVLEHIDSSQVECSVYSWIMIPFAQGVPNKALVETPPLWFNVVVFWLFIVFLPWITVLLVSQHFSFQQCMPMNAGDWFRDMRNMKMLWAMALENWLVVCSGRNSELAHSLVNCLRRVAGPMGFRIEYPKWWEMLDHKVFFAPRLLFTLYFFSCQQKMFYPNRNIHRRCLTQAWEVSGLNQM